MRRDGNWWRTFSDDGKANYMVGFFDGLVLGGHFSQWNLKNKDGKLDTAEALRVMDSFKVFYTLMRSTTNGQFVEG
jgi:hypothetical protein